MLGQLLSLSPRRLITVGLIVGGGLLAVLLIILWQVGVFDSPPPPATLESAVESLRQDQQQQGQPTQAASTAQPQEQAQAGQSSPPAASEQADQEEQAVQTQADSDPQQSVSTSSSAADYGSGQAQQTVADEDGQQDAQPSPPSDQQQAEPQADPQPQAQQSAQEQTAAATAPSSLSELAGTWMLSARGESFVGYRIGEELANIGTTTAVGRTSDIVATLAFDGAAITSVTIEADLRTLKSDESFRDGALRTRGLESDTYPFATFILTEPIVIDALPVGEATLDVTVLGTLDLHGVTNPVSIALAGQYVDGLVVVVGSTEIALADYDIEKPTGFRVLSIEDVGIMEFQLVLERAP